MMAQDSVRNTVSNHEVVADHIAEHSVENTEGGVDTPSTTSCFLESEEGSVSPPGSHSY